MSLLETWMVKVMLPVTTNLRKMMCTAAQGEKRARENVADLLQYLQTPSGTRLIPLRYQQ